MRNASLESEQYRGMPDIPAEHMPPLKLIGKADQARPMKKLQPMFVREVRDCGLRSGCDGLRNSGKSRQPFLLTMVFAVVCVMSAIAIDLYETRIEKIVCRA